MVLYPSALQPVSNLLARPLESPFPPLNNAHLPQGIAGIAVLGAAYTPHDGIPITAALPGDGLARVAEGVRLREALRWQRAAGALGRRSARPYAQGVRARLRRFLRGIWASTRPRLSCWINR